MKGLLLKDFSLMKMQKKFFIVIVGIALFMAIGMKDLDFMVGYMSFIIPLYSLSTISYDEFDNGNAFLFTLPITRKSYVLEKYVFSISLGLASFLLGILLSILVGYSMHLEGVKEVLVSSPFIFAIMILFISIMAPLQLKYGAEKSRVAIILVFGGLMAVGYAGIALLDLLQIDKMALLNTLLSFDMWIILVLLAIVVGLILYISIQISITIMQKKQF